MLSPYIPAKTSVTGIYFCASVVSVVKHLIKFKLRNDSNEIGEYRVVKSERRPRRPMLVVRSAVPHRWMGYCTLSE